MKVMRISLENIEITEIKSFEITGKKFYFIFFLIISDYFNFYVFYFKFRTYLYTVGYLTGVYSYHCSLDIYRMYIVYDITFFIRNISPHPQDRKKSIFL